MKPLIEELLNKYKDELKEINSSLSKEKDIRKKVPDMLCKVYCEEFISDLESVYKLLCST